MDGTILAKTASCIDAIIARMDFDETDWKIRLIYELLSVSGSPGHYKSLADIR
ncbi:hypothetical protein [Methanolobus chelungpuianus]|uniref:hypothetical protein n=1 Tax=Methanolobus chelungpuianus TaxID=502115 RepID=UPI0021143269|nr:hypothetical protein [Methanolobus chelungpuianus]